MQSSQVSVSVTDRAAVAGLAVSCQCAPATVNRHSQPRPEMRASYTAADSIPYKLISDSRLVNIIANRKVIPPYHVQFIPTNKCNMHCTFCSCADEDRSLEMNIYDAERIISIMHELGTRAVTITGGGEPLMYRHLSRLVWGFVLKNIAVGMVTNGLLLHKARLALKPVTWCRISSGDDRTFTGDYDRMLDGVVLGNPHIDWAFSHVVSRHPNIDTIRAVIDFANTHEFTHVRLVADLLDYENVDMEALQYQLEDMGLDLSRVIFQARNEPTRGMPCYVCYLKPVITADCKMYACCGAQYALDPPSKKMPDELCLGSAFDIERIIMRSATPFDGSICKRCYYGSYNRVLEGMIGDMEHEDWV